MFSKFVNFVIDLKSGTHIDWTYMYVAKKCIDQNNVTHASMATIYPIMKHFKTFWLKMSVRNVYQTLMTGH